MMANERSRLRTRERSSCVRGGFGGHRALLRNSRGSDGKSRPAWRRRLRQAAFGIKSQGSAISLLQGRDGFDPPLGEQLADNIEHPGLPDTGAGETTARPRPRGRHGAEFAGRGLQFQGPQAPALQHLNHRTSGGAVVRLPDPESIRQSQFDRANLTS